MQIFAIVVSLAIAAVGIALFVKAIRTDHRDAQDRPAGRRPQRRQGRPLDDHAQGDPGPHPDAPVDRGRHRPLVRLHRVRAAVLHPGDRVRPALRRALRAAADRPLLPLRVGLRVLHPRDAGRDRRPSSATARPGPASAPAARKGRFYGSTMWQGYFVEAVILGVGLCIVVLRGAEYAIAQYAGDPASALHFPFTLPRSARRSRGCPSRTLANVDLPRRDAQDRHLVHLDDRDLAEHHDGRRLAPVHRVLQHLVQARGRRRHGARRPPADDGRRRADRLREHRGPRRGRRRSASARSRTSPGRASSTSPRAPSAAAASRQCPAWNTEKPLSPKLLITALRDHALRQGAVPAGRRGRPRRRCSRATTP